MAKLVLIRHGQSEWNALNLFNGWVDTKLSEQGIEQAKHAGELLKQEGIVF
nr:histidine phosphatase family protein [Serratia marcescens]